MCTQCLRRPQGAYGVTPVRSAYWCRTACDSDAKQIGTHLVDSIAFWARVIGSGLPSALFRYGNQVHRSVTHPVPGSGSWPRRHSLIARHAATDFSP